LIKNCKQKLETCKYSTQLSSGCRSGSKNSWNSFK